MQTAELTRAMVHGDEAAYRTFYEAYFPRVFRYLLVVCAGNEEEAKEALQLTMLRVVRYIKVLNSDEELWGWLTLLARSVARDEFRKRSRYARLLGNIFQPGETPTPDDKEDNLSAILEAELRRMSVEDQDVLERKYVKRQQVTQIAAVLGTTEKAVESRLVRARRKLKELLIARLKDAH